MKTLSLKLDDKIFSEAEEIAHNLKLSKNRYIIDAIRNYNKLYKRQLLKLKIAKESTLTMSDSLSILLEYEKLEDIL